MELNITTIVYIMSLINYLVKTKAIESYRRKIPWKSHLYVPTFL